VQNKVDVTFVMLFLAKLEGLNILIFLSRALCEYINMVISIPDFYSHWLPTVQVTAPTG